MPYGGKYFCRKIVFKIILYHHPDKNNQYLMHHRLGQTLKQDKNSRWIENEKFRDKEETKISNLLLKSTHNSNMTVFR